MTHTGDIIFIRDCLTTAIREIEAAEELTGMYSLEDLVDLLKEAVDISDEMMGKAI